MPMCAVVLPVPAAVPPVRSITLSVSTPEAETLYRHPMPSVTLPRAPNGLRPVSGRGVRGVFRGASSGVEVFDCGDAAQVEEILARAAVAGLRSLSGSEMCEAMFDAGPCPQAFAANWRFLELA